jgi:flagellar motor switch protein FliM
MTDQPILSGEEIAALMSRGDDRAAGRDGAKSRQPRSFSFGDNAAPPSTALPALDRMNDRLARRLRDAIEPFLRVKPKVDAEPALMRPLGDWQAEQPSFAGLALYTFKPLKGNLTLAIPSEFVSRLVDAFYGGTGAAPITQGKEFTRTEESLFAKLTDALVAAFADIWREVAPIDPQLRGRETNVAMARIGAADESMVVSRFTVTLAQGKPAAIDILFPAAALRSVEGAIAAQGEETCGKGAEWRAQLGAALGEIRIEARTVLARPELNLSELMQLKVGDVIPVSIPPLVPLLVEGRTVAVGSIGDQDGKAALKIERVQTRRLAA